MCRLLQIWAVSLSCICWDAQHRAGQCPLPEIRETNGLMTELYYGDDAKIKNEMKHSWAASYIPCPWSSFWRRRRAGTPQWRRGLFLWPHAEECCTAAVWTMTCTLWLLFVCKSTSITHNSPNVYQYNSMFTDTPTFVAFTLSRTFRSAPWLLRTWTTPRSPPLQAQWMAPEPSWNTAGAPHSISCADLRQPEVF